MSHLMTRKKRSPQQIEQIFWALNNYSPYQSVELFKGFIFSYII